MATSADAGFGSGFGYNIDEHWLTSFEFQYNQLSLVLPLDPVTALVQDALAVFLAERPLLG